MKEVCSRRTFRSRETSCTEFFPRRLSASVHPRLVGGVSGPDHTDVQWKGLGTKGRVRLLLYVGAPEKKGGEGRRGFAPYSTEAL